jgi:4-amino-4-deoxy-L-arabinose transferase-like glycosyltransferase
MRPAIPPFLAGLLALAAVPFVPVRVASEDGGYTLEGFWVLAGALALLATAAGTALRAPAAGRRLAVLALGYAGQLALTEPLWLDHVRVRPHELRDPSTALGAACVALQVVLALRWTWRERRALLAGTAGVLDRRLLVLGGLLILAAGAHVTKIWPRRDQALAWAFLAVQLGAAAVFVATNLLHVLAVLRALPQDILARAEHQAGRFGLGGSEGPPGRLDRLWPWGLALAATLFGTAMAYGVLDAIPHIQDEVAFLVQARTYAQGRLDLPVPPEPEAFAFYLLHVEGDRLYGAMNPGWPLVLVPSVLLGLPHLMNPLISGLTILLAHALVRRVAGRGLAHLAAGLLACSPWFLCVGGSLMTQPLSLLLSLLAAWLSVRAAQEGRSLAALGAGLSLGLQFLVRPLDAVVVGAVLGAGLLLHARPRFGLRAWSALLAGGLATSIWFFPFNLHFTGNPFRFTISHYFDRIWYPGADDLGFGPEVGNPRPERWVHLDPEPGHGLVDVLLNANQNLHQIHLELFGLGIGSLALVLFHLARGRLSLMDRGVLLFSLLLVAAYSTYWFSGGPDYGARYWYLTIFPLVWLTARGLQTLAGALAARGVAFPGGGVLLGTGLLLALSSTLFVPWRLIAKYPHYRSSHDDVRKLANGARFGDALVFIEVEDQVEYGPALVLNSFPIGARGRPVFARDLGAESRARLHAAFPDRPVWRLRGRSAGAAHGTEVLEGPLPPLLPR